jgi:hypothetical protein
MAEKNTILPGGAEQLVLNMGESEREKIKSLRSLREAFGDFKSGLSNLVESHDDRLSPLRDEYEGISSRMLDAREMSVDEMSELTKELKKKSEVIEKVARKEKDEDDARKAREDLKGTAENVRGAKMAFRTLETQFNALKGLADGDELERARRRYENLEERHLNLDEMTGEEAGSLRDDIVETGDDFEALVQDIKSRPGPEPSIRSKRFENAENNLNKSIGDLDAQVSAFEALIEDSPIVRRFKAGEDVLGRDANRLLRRADKEREMYDGYADRVADFDDAGRTEETINAMRDLENEIDEQSERMQGEIDDIRKTQETVSSHEVTTQVTENSIQKLEEAVNNFNFANMTNDAAIGEVNAMHRTLNGFKREFRDIRKSGATSLAQEDLRDLDRRIGMELDRVRGKLGVVAEEEVRISDPMRSRLEALMNDGELVRRVAQETVEEKGVARFEDASDKEKLLMLLGENVNRSRRDYTEKRYEKNQVLKKMKRLFGSVTGLGQKMGEFGVELDNSDRIYKDARNEYKNAILDLEGVKDEKEIEILLRHFMVSERLSFERVMSEVRMERNPIFEKSKQVLLGAAERYRKIRNVPSEQISRLTGSTWLGLGLGYFLSARGFSEASSHVPVVKEFATVLSVVGFKKMLEANAEIRKQKKADKIIGKRARDISTFERVGRMEEILRNQLENVNEKLAGQIQSEERWRKFRSVLAVGAGAGMYFGGSWMGDRISDAVEKVIEIFSEDEFVPGTYPAYQDVESPSEWGGDIFDLSGDEEELPGGVRSMEMSGGEPGILTVDDEPELTVESSEVNIVELQGKNTDEVVGHLLADHPLKDPVSKAYEMTVSGFGIDPDGEANLIGAIESGEVPAIVEFQNQLVDNLRSGVGEYFESNDLSLSRELTGEEMLTIFDRYDLNMETVEVGGKEITVEEAVLNPIEVEKMIIAAKEADVPAGPAVEPGATGEVPPEPASPETSLEDAEVVSDENRGMEIAYRLRMSPGQYADYNDKTVEQIMGEAEIRSSGIRLRLAELLKGLEGKVEFTENDTLRDVFSKCDPEYIASVESIGDESFTRSLADYKLESSAREVLEIKSELSLDSEDTWKSEALGSADSKIVDKFHEKVVALNPEYEAAEKMTIKDWAINTTWKSIDNGQHSEIRRLLSEAVEEVAAEEAAAEEAAKKAAAEEAAKKEAAETRRRGPAISTF